MNAVLPDDFWGQSERKDPAKCWRCSRNVSQTPSGLCLSCRDLLRDPTFTAGRPRYEHPTDIPPDA